MGAAVEGVPGTLDASDTFGRLSAPFGYWNAVGLAGALGLPGCLWVERQARARARLILRTLVAPAVANAAWRARAVVWTRGAGGGGDRARALVRRRCLSGCGLRLVLAPGGGSARRDAIVWALGSHSLTHDKVELAARVSAGHTFGLVLVLGLAVVTAAGLWRGDRGRARDASYADARARARGRCADIAGGTRSRSLGVAALSASSRGLTGEISHVVGSADEPGRSTGDSAPGRLVTTRARAVPIYWREGLLVGEHARARGRRRRRLRRSPSLRYVQNQVRRSPPGRTAT